MISKDIIILRSGENTLEDRIEPVLTVIVIVCSFATSTPEPTVIYALLGLKYDSLFNQVDRLHLIDNQSPKYS